MASKINIGNLSSEVMRQLNEYADLTTEGMKTAVQNAGKTVQKEIKGTAPKDTGAYSKSWAVKKTSESSRALEVTVHSRNRYQLAHLLEFGHVDRQIATGVDKQISRHTRSTDYDCTVQLPSGEQMELSISARTYKKIEIGGDIVVARHDGAFCIPFSTVETLSTDN